jgi:hypothetical protein
MTIGQNQDFAWGSNVFPPPTGTGNTLLADTDITNQKILDFFSGVLQLNLGSRWAQQCTSAGLVNSNLQNMIDGSIVGSTICHPLPSTLKQTDYHFPILSAYRQDEHYRQMTNNKVVIESNFIITFTLPPLNSPEQLNLIYPFLQAASKTILFYGTAGSDPKYNNGELVWAEAGFAFALMEGCQYGSFLGQAGKEVFPSVKINFKVFEENHFVPEDYIPLTGFDGYISELDGYNINNPITNFIEFQTNLTFNISELSQTSGSKAGGQMVIIEGTGFQEANLVRQNQITFAGQSVQSFLVKSDTVIIAITGYTVSPISGPVIITDDNGNQAISSVNYSYV